ncbi:MAG: tetratricopeptide repeat-containing sensor histidine kinase [Bacteroidetes bacterium]|nr:tetratricopeptide repeat-containing sensor histidine kinase [Bacteroidota bacterium]
MKCLQHHIQKISVILFFVTLCVQLFADNQDKIDSFKNILTSAETEQNVFALNRISEFYWAISTDSSLKYANKALRISKNINFDNGIASAYLHLGGSYYYISDYYQAIKYFKLSLELWEKIGDQKNEAAILSNLSMIYVTMGLYEKALDYNIQSQKICEKINDSEGIATAHYINSSIYDNLNNDEKALSEGFTALGLFIEQKNDRYHQSSLNNIGSIYDKQHKDSLALVYYFKSTYLSESVGDSWSGAYAIGNIGSVYNRMGMKDSAIYYCLKSLRFFRKFKDKNGIAKALLTLANVHFENSDLDSTFYYLEEGYSIAKEIHDMDLMLSYNKLYSDYYILFNNYEKAYFYHKAYTETKDSIYAEKTKNKITDYQIEIETAQIQAEKEIQELRARKSLTQRNFSILISFLVLLLAILFFSRYTLKKRTNTLLEQKNVELQNANNTKDKFFAIVSHDLKNQLTAFQNISSVLAENFKTIAEEKKHHLILRINTASNTLYGVLENLLTWSSSQLQGVDYKPFVLSIKSVCENTIKELRLNAERKKITFSCEISDNLEAFADENMLRTVIRNLTNNAVKFSPEDSNIELKAELQNEMVFISVIDHGIGLSKSDVEKLFRIDVNHKEIGSGKDKGSGLGLVITKEFVEKMGGQIFIESELGKGSSFSFSIPAKKV